MNTNNKVIEYLKNISQESVINYIEKLDEKDQEAFLNNINIVEIEEIFNSLKPREALNINSDNCSPMPPMTIPEINENKDYYFNLGVKSIKNNEVAAVLLAGGQGSRLGNAISKGMVDIGITKQVYILECIFNRLKHNAQLANGNVKLYIMTSEDNHIPLLNFLSENNYFGYDQHLVKLFKQNMLPVLDLNYNLIVGNKGLVKAPNGNGGWVASLYSEGIWEEIISSNIKWINVFSIDNVLQNIVDPVFIGATISKECVSSGKVVMKTSIEEAVGTICKINGKPDIIEYFEMPDELKLKVDDEGIPIYNYGVTLNYLFQVNALEQFISKKLPLHCAQKKIKYYDVNNNLVIPNFPNAYKFETLLIDMIRCMDSFLPFEIERKTEFAPIKNRHGADSIDTARELLRNNGIEL